MCDLVVPLLLPSLSKCFLIRGWVCENPKFWKTLITYEHRCGLLKIAHSSYSVQLIKEMKQSYGRINCLQMPQHVRVSGLNSESTTRLGSLQIFPVERASQEPLLRKSYRMPFCHVGVPATVRLWGWMLGTLHLVHWFLITSQGKMAKPWFKIDHWWQGTMRCIGRSWCLSLSESSISWTISHRTQWIPWLSDIKNRML